MNTRKSRSSLKQLHEGGRFEGDGIGEEFGLYGDLQNPEINNNFPLAAVNPSIGPDRSYS